MKEEKARVYKTVVKRSLDFLLSLMAIVLLSPLIVLLTIVGCWKMKGNPFFSQERPGKDGRIFKLIKFRTMTNEKDDFGNFLPDEQRLVPYGKFLRSTSLDELPELFNILIGQMSFIGPRPLLVKYLRYYNAYEMRRHEVRPGLTGLAQINGRNRITWRDKFKTDVEYVDSVSFKLDCYIFFQTIKKVIKREGIEFKSSDTVMDYFQGTNRIK